MDSQFIRSSNRRNRSRYNEKIKIAREKYKKVVRVVKRINIVEVKVLREDEQQIEKELMLKKEKVYVLKDEKLRVKIIQLHHDIPVAGHGERWNMTELVTRNYQWLRVMKNVKRYVNRCDMCQRIQNCMEALVGKIIANEILEKLQAHLMVDFITKLLLVARKDIILVVYNRLSKIIYFVATIERTSVEGLMRLFRDNICMGFQRA